MQPPIYELTDVEQRYGGRLVLRVPALEIQPGETLALVGPSGAGKSTLLRLLNFLEPPSAGRLAYLGQAVSAPDVPLALLRQVTTVFQRPALLSAIDAIQMQYGTAVGNAIVLSLAELFPDHGIDLTEMTFGPRRRARSLDEKPKPRPVQIRPVPPGSYDAAAIILLSDGRRTTGVDTLQAAKMAADRGVRIYVIGLGTVDGQAMMGEGMAIYLQLDEPTLREVARMTGGEYHHAGTAEDLRSVYQNLGSRLQVKTRETELTALVVSLAAALLVAGAALSVLWFGRVA